MNVFIHAIVRISSFGERLILPFNSAIAALNGTINLSPHENILTIALTNIHYLYNLIVHFILPSVVPNLGQSEAFSPLQTVRQS